MKTTTPFAACVAALLVLTATAAAQDGPTYASDETRDVIHRMIDAHGGLERWRAAPTLSYDNIFFNPFAEDGSEAWWVSNEVIEQGSRRVYQTWPLDHSSLSYDGTTVWSTGWKRGNPPQHQALFFYYFVNLPWLTQDPGVVLGAVERVPLPSVDGEFFKVKMEFTDDPAIGKSSLDSYTLYIDPESYRLRGYEYRMGWGPMLDLMGVPEGEIFGPMLRIHDDFTTVDGLVMPIRMTTMAPDGSQIFGHHTMLNYSFSRPFDEAWMSRSEDAVIDELTNERASEGN